MERKNLGQLIAALRRERLDKHLSPWTRQHFARESGIDQEILANIETGRRAIFYPDLLLKLAEALQLTSVERREFFLAASGVDEGDMYLRRRNTGETLHSLLALMGQLQAPAFLVDQYWDMVAINQAIIEIYNTRPEVLLNPASNPATRFNMMRVLFSDEFSAQKAMLGNGWEQFAIESAMLFRASSLRYRATDYFQFLYPQLCEFDDFRNYIQRKPRDDTFLDNMFITLDNPRLGLIRTISTSLVAATTEGELTLSTFTPLDPQTVQIFANICAQGNPVLTIFPHWPDKSTIFLA